MTVTDARRWIIVWSIAITGAQMVFLIVAPSVGFPLESPKNIEILQIITPVFVGYLGTATHFVFRDRTPTVRAKNQYLGILVKAPLFIYALVVASTFLAFGYSNRVEAAVGDGMTVSALSMSLSVVLGLLAATTSVLTSYLFVAAKPVIEAS